jgi:lipopolysaccharide transport system permease protein
MLARLVELYRYRELLYVLIYRDVKARTKQAFLGYSWIVVQPLLAMGIFSLIVQVVLNLDLTDTPYPLFLFCGLVCWQYFANSLSAATESLVLHQDLLTQVYFPREVLPLYPILGKLLDLGISSLMLAVLLIVYRTPVGWGVLLTPLVITVQIILTFGLALMLAPLNVAMRDVSRALPILLSFFMYAAPVLYPLERVPERLMGVYLLNPMAILIATFRALILGGQVPAPHYLVLAVVVSLVTLVIAYRLFQIFELMLADIV